MIIAFEGPDKTGKSTSANQLSHNGNGLYNMTKETHSIVQEDLENEKELVQAFDRIDWLTHMVYRLAMPDREWNDARVRTVFAAPDTHLVFKIHEQGQASQIDDELYKRGDLTAVNDVYRHVAGSLMMLNENRDFSLFRTVTVMEVFHDMDNGTFFQRMVDFSSPVFPFGAMRMKPVWTNQDLLEVLRREEENRI